MALGGLDPDTIRRIRDLANKKIITIPTGKEWTEVWRAINPPIKSVAVEPITKEKLGAVNGPITIKTNTKTMSIFDQALEQFANDVTTKANKAVDDGLARVVPILEKAEKLANVAKVTRAIAIYLDGKELSRIDGLKHMQLDNLIKMVHVSEAVLMVGMAGTGKTKGAEQAAEALNLAFYMMSVGAQTTKSDIIGFMNANGVYVKSHFREAYEKGGLFLMDEVDAGNANVLIQINSALSNGLCAFPDAIVKKHPNFRFVGTANTFGTGADRMYVGRNILDAATLDRFATIEWAVDETLERAIVSGYKHGKAWHEKVQKIRKHTIDNKIPALVTPRATIKGAKLLEVGFDIPSVAEMVIFSSYPKDKVANVRNLIK